jgi:hypothetical protein
MSASQNDIQLKTRNIAFLLTRSGDRVLASFHSELFHQILTVFKAVFTEQCGLAAKGGGAAPTAPSPLLAAKRGRTIEI